MAIDDRVSPDGRTLTGEGRALEGVELWYFKEHWHYNPQVMLCGTHQHIGDLEGGAYQAVAAPRESFPSVDPL